MMTNILYRIDKQLSDFTKTEKIIADYILKNPHKIIDMTVNDLADVTNVSTASIVRFSRKMTLKQRDIVILSLQLNYYKKLVYLKC